MIERLLFRRLAIQSLKKEALIAVKPGSIYDLLSLEATLTERCVVFPGWSLLLVYISNPCVVVGRHQNPWLECCLDKLVQNETEIARRISGGGAVYHDQGNVNFSFISDRNDYDRRRNLGVLVSALKSCGVPGTDLAVTDKFDVLLGGHKISGTAARLDKATSLHHFTCLVDANLKAINSYLKPSFAPEQVVSSRATPSRVTNVTNVAAPNSSSQSRSSGWSFSNDILIANFINSYFSLPTLPDNNDDIYPICDSNLCSTEEILSYDNMLLTDFARRQAEYRTWDWIYGKSPPFVIQHLINVKGTMLKIRFCLEAGCVSNVQIRAVDSVHSASIIDCENRLRDQLKDLPLRSHDVQLALSKSPSPLKSELDRLIFENVFSFLLNVSINDVKPKKQFTVV